MQAGPGNAFAVLIVIEDAISAWLNDHPLPPGPSDQSVSIPVPPQLSTALATGFSAAAPFGFLQLAVLINTNPPCVPSENTVEFDLTHPFDPGPVVTNSLSPQGPFHFQPQIGTSVSQVNAGGKLDVYG